MGIIFAISTTEKERNGHENFSDREVLFLILEIDFPLRRNYTDSWHRNVCGTRIRLFIVPDDSVFRTCTIYYRVNFQQKTRIEFPWEIQEKKKRSLVFAKNIIRQYFHVLQEQSTPTG